MTKFLLCCSDLKGIRGKTSCEAMWKVINDRLDQPEEILRPVRRPMIYAVRRPMIYVGFLLLRRQQAVDGSSLAAIQRDWPGQEKELQEATMIFFFLIKGLYYL